MLTTFQFIPDESDLTQLEAIVGMTNKHEWLGTSGLKQLLMLVGFIHLLWQWQIMQGKEVQLPQHVTVVSLLNKGVLLAWHFWRLYSSSSVSLITSSKHMSTEGGTITGKHWKNTINAMHIMMHDHDMSICCDWANATSNHIKWSWFEPRVQIQTPNVLI